MDQQKVIGCNWVVYTNGAFSWLPKGVIQFDLQVGAASTCNNQEKTKLCVKPQRTSFENRKTKITYATKHKV